MIYGCLVPTDISILGTLLDPLILSYTTVGVCLLICITVLYPNIVSDLKINTCMHHSCQHGWKKMRDVSSFALAFT